jgi:hypothetical protein
MAAATTGANFLNVTWSNTTCPDGTNSNATEGHASVTWRTSISVV